MSFFSDFRFVVLWWLTYLFFGLSGFPLGYFFFHKFWDKGYVFAKTIGLALVTFLVLTLGIFKLVPFTTSSVFVFMILVCGMGLYLLHRSQLLTSFKTTFIKNWRYFLFEEIIFFVILTIWSYVRGFAPDIEGLEKFMDWGFINSALRSQFMPPLDMWFASLPINYYYFGHLEMAVMTKLNSIDSAIIYNLAIASTCAITFTSAFSLASNMVASLFKKSNLKLIILGGLISAIMLSFGGNLHPIYKIGSLIVKNEGHLTLAPASISRAASMYWYPDATRFIGFDPDVQDKTIHEFPLYSFVVADLHGHMNDIPNVLLLLAILLSIFLYTRIDGVSWLLAIPIALLLSVAFMTNAWDFAVYGLIYGVFSFFALWHQDNLKKSIFTTITNGLLIIILWYIFTLPFSLNFTPMAEGLKLSDSHSRLYQLFILYGGFWLIALPFVMASIRAILLRRHNLTTTDFFALALITTATILVILPEIGYIKDIYIYEHRRANTMFKLVYQAFMMYSLVSGYILIKFRHSKLAKTLIILIFAIHLIYPYFAIKSYYGLISYKGLWGLNFLKNSYPDNLDAINWINKNISGQPVILEAVGDSYTTFNQVSVATGLPTVQGWVVHEWLWRGGYDKPAARQTDVQKIYEAVKVEDARPLLQKYSVQYVFVGDKEREKYPALNEKIFIDMGAKIIFESGQTRVYKLY